jgi:hypothetical protein
MCAAEPSSLGDDCSLLFAAAAWPGASSHRPVRPRVACRIVAEADIMRGSYLSQVAAVH